MNCDELSLVPGKQQCYTVQQIAAYCTAVSMVFILMLALSMIKVFLLRKQKRRMQTIIKHNLAVPDKEQRKKFEGV